MQAGELITAFARFCGRRPELIVSAPGRINLLGDHTDYNDGLVLPMAIDRAIGCASAKRADGRIRLHSLQMNPVIEIAVSEIVDTPPRQAWADYPLGALREILLEGIRFSGFDMLFSGDLPSGAGLGSSAALEVATLTAVDALFDLHISLRDKIQLAHRAEKSFVGGKGGISGPFIAVAGRAERALLLDCQSLASHYLPLQLGKMAVLLIDSQTSDPQLANALGERRAECAAAVAVLQRHDPAIRSLRDVSVLQLQNTENHLPAVLYRRARHVVTENKRVCAGAEAVRWQNFAALGSLMLASHVSLKEDYEVSRPELDFLVDAVMALPGSHGARQTGAGSARCTVNLVDSEKVADICQGVRSAYRAKFQREVKCFLARADDGARVVWKA